MEEILNKIEEFKKYVERKNELDVKKSEIKKKEAEIKELSTKISMEMLGSATKPVLEEQIQEASQELENMKLEYRTNYSKAEQDFNADKEELRGIVQKELSSYKRKTEIEQAKENVNILKRETEHELEQKRKSTEQVVNKLEERRNRYSQIAEDARKDIGNAKKAFLDGKKVDQTQLGIARTDLEANSRKVDSITVQIEEAKNGLLAEIKEKGTEVENYEKEVNNYKPIEEHMDEVNDLEHLGFSINSMSFDKASDIDNNPNIVSIRAREEARKQQAKLAGAQATGPVPSQGTATQPTGSSPAQTTIINQSQQTAAPTQVITPKIKSITIGKKITIEYENGKVDSTKLSQRTARNISKLDGVGKSKIISDVTGEDIQLADEVLDKVDPTVIYLLQEAQTIGYVAQEHVKEVINNYIGALSGISDAKENINGLITYDRTGMDYWKPKTFISKIINHRYYKAMAEHMDAAKDFVKIIKDKKGKGLRDLISGRKQKLLDAGKAKASDLQKAAAQKVTGIADNTKTVVQGKAEGVKQAGKKFRNSLAAKLQVDEEKTLTDNSSDPKEQSASKSEPDKDEEGR